MQRGYINLNGQSHYLTDAGHAYAGWLEYDGSKYYYDYLGVMQTGWLEYDGSYYYFGSDGVMQTGWIELDGKTHYLTDTGAAYTGWLDQEDSRSYFDSKGCKQTGWVEVDGKHYYLDENGLMQTGWIELDGQKHYLTTDGSAYTGWLEQDGKKFYFDSKGVMQTGWIATSQARYYLQEDGSLATGFVTIDGIERYFTANGEYVPLINAWNAVPGDYIYNLVWLNGFQVDATCRDGLQQMLRDCRAAGYSCELNSTYRGISTQKDLWRYRYNTYLSEGYSEDEAYTLTCRRVAYPGTSEHHTGLAVDILGSDAMYKWLADNSWRYGFIERYPDGKTYSTGIIYEPWHFRYVGKEVAKAIYESGLTLEEWLQSQKG